MQQTLFRAFGYAHFREWCIVQDFWSLFFVFSGILFTANPTVCHDGSEFTWTNGKQLTAATAADGTVISYSYDTDGLRLTKVIDGVTYNYQWQSDRLVRAARHYRT